MARIGFRAKAGEPPQPRPCECGAKVAPFGLNFGERRLCRDCWELLPERQAMISDRLRAALEED